MGGKEIVVAVMNFEFMGGSMGMALGKGLLIGAKHAINSEAPLVAVTSSGGARMQEGAISLMQLAKTTSRLARFSKNGGLYIIKNGKKILLDSYAHTGDLIIIKADTPHGVDIIDINKIYKPLSFKGRWMVIFSTNKLSDNNKIKNSKLFKK